LNTDPSIAGQGWPAGGQSLESVRRATREARIVITGITPAVDNGAFAAKRVAGDAVRVEADIFTDGHQSLAAALLYRADDEHAWQRAPMRFLVNDRWVGEFPLRRTGPHSFTIEAWIDIFAGFVRDLGKKRDAAVDTALDVAEGRALIEAARARSKGETRTNLATLLEDFDARPQSGREELLFAAETARLMQEADAHPFRVQSAAFPVEADRERARFASWYELFPRSQTDHPARHGTFADVIARLPAIRDMGFDVLYLPPIHPVGATNRKGRNNALRARGGDPGSVYAIGSQDGGHDAVEPQLGSLDDFRALIKAVRKHGMELALDYAVQCSPDHPWLKDHPGWFDWRADGSIKYAENPPKTYEDIVNVDFYTRDAMPDLWLALRDIVLFWAGEGVRIFRVDNPHTKPFAFWQWMIADARAKHPDIVFLSEAFTRPKVMYHLAKLGFTQSYTYFTWRDVKHDLMSYMRELTAPPVSDFFRPHFFVNTPDINPYFLQASGRPGFLIRAALAATLSGLWGMYSGFELCEAEAPTGREEYLNSEKYEIKPRDWNAPGNIIREIAQLNRLRKAHPALQTHMGLTFYNAFNDHVLYYAKHAPGDGSRILVMVLLDPHGARETSFEIPLWEWGLADHEALDAEDLLSGARFTWRGKIQHERLFPDAPYRIWRVAPAGGL
jgi:starch synthase (maltosyl-transferring)